MRNKILFLSFGLILSGCAARILQHERSDEVLKVEEFDKKVVVKEEENVPPPPLPEVKETTPAKPGKKAIAKNKVSPEKKKVKPKGPRQPEIEDSAGFEGRRPLKDPFRVGEKTTFDMSYFNIVAGTVTTEFKPMVNVNGVKAYHIEVTAQSNSFFSRIYTVEDKATTYLSYEDLVPLNLQISIKESKQLAETRTLFDWTKLQADYWQKRITKEKGERSKKLEWKIEPYAQNVITAAFYLRVFQLEVGKTYSFRVADEGKNIVFSAEVLRREVLKTAIGDLKTVVLKPSIVADGVFKPVGEILVWFTDDERKHMVRLESKIRIGSIVAKIKSLEKGLD